MHTPGQQFHKEKQSLYAIIEAGGKQYRVSEGDLIDVERQSGEVGQSVDFQEVLLVGDQDNIHVGTPTLAGAQVVGTIAEQGKEAKIIVFKFKRRKKYRRRQGHRQLFTRVRIDQIKLDGKKAQKPTAEKTKKAVAAKTPAQTAKKKAAKKVAAKKTAPKAAKKKTTAKGVKRTSKKGASKTTKKTAKKSTKKAATKKSKE